MKDRGTNPLVFCSLKGPGHEMEFVLLTCIEKYRPKNMGRGRFFNFSHVQSLEEKNTFTVLPVNANPTPLDHFIRLYLVYISLPIINQGSRPLLPPLAGRGCKFYDTFFDH
jgi:hypothetical protein